APLNVSDRWEQRPRVRQVPTARPLGRLKQLSDAARQTVVKQPVAGADDAALAVGVGGAHTRLDIVQIGFADVARRACLEVVAKTVGECEPLARAHLVLGKKSV